MLICWADLLKAYLNQLNELFSGNIRRSMESCKFDLNYEMNSGTDLNILLFFFIFQKI